MAIKYKVVKYRNVGLCAMDIFDNVTKLLKDYLQVEIKKDSKIVCGSSLLFYLCISGTKKTIG